MKKKQQRNEKLGAINEGALDELIEGYGHTPEAILGEGGLLAQLTKALVERALGAELGHHLQSEREAGEGEIASLEGGAGAGAGNCRNGFSRKVVLGDSGKLEIAVPRDRRGSFEPRLVPKWKKRLPGFDAKIIALYARGLTVREPEHSGDRQPQAAPKG